MHRYTSRQPHWIDAKEAEQVRDKKILLPNGNEASVLLVEGADHLVAPYVILGTLELVFLTPRALADIEAGRCDLRDLPPTRDVA